MRIISYTTSASTLCNMCDAGLDVTLLELVNQPQLVISGYQLIILVL